MTAVESTYVLYLQNLLRQNRIEFLERILFDQKVEHQPKSSEQQDIANSFNIKLNHKNFLSTNLKQQLSGNLVERYSRQMLLKQISYEGQYKILNTKVAIIGGGGIGCPLALYLAGAGVGTIGIFDSDTVELTNLHRQIAHKTRSVGIKKTQSLKQSLLDFNPNIKVLQHQFISVSTVHELNDYDLVIDGSDNPQCRYIVNDFCMQVGKKLLSGACIGWQGQVTCYGGQNGPCYRCVWGNEQKTTGGCSTLGVLGMLPGIVGLILATQAIKLILNSLSSLQGYLLTFDSKGCNFRKLKLRNKLKQCSGCGQSKVNMKNYQYSKHAICKPDLSNLPKVQQITWEDFLKVNVQNNQIKLKLLDVRPSNQFNICHLSCAVSVPFQKLAKLQKQQLLNELQSNEIIKKESNNKIYVSCNRGVMSKKAADLLNKIGLNAISVKGGITQYSKSFDNSVPIL